jgi:ParB family transcriptional regulator, chromosome partitioning protein
VRGHRVKHECVVRIGRVTERESLRHARTLPASAAHSNRRCRLRCASASPTLAAMAKTGLGKGLGALIGPRPPSVAAPAKIDNLDVAPGDRIHRLKLDAIAPSPMQPRKEFAREALQELMDSIREHGIIQPLIVRRVNGRHELIAGERRWRAAKELGLTEVPAIIRSSSDLEVLALSLIENLQREDLNPIEEAQGYARLADEFGMRQEDIAQKVGRSRAAVANAMRLLDLHPQIQTWLNQQLLTVGHAKAILGIKAHDEQLEVAETVLRRKATVRQTERLVARQLGGRGAARRSARSTSRPNEVAIADVQERLQQHLGTRVTIHHGDKRGRIEIEYYGPADLDRITGALGLTNPES